MDHIRIDGALTWWKTPEYVELQRFNTGMEFLGFEKHKASPRTPGAALKDALKEIYKDVDYIVQRMKTTDAFQVDRIKRGTIESGGNRSEPVLMARIDANHQILFDTVTSEAQSVIDAFNNHLGLIRGTIMSRSLVGVVHELSGTRLREDGGIYWLPESSLDKWAQVGNIVASAGLRSRARMYIVRHNIDPDAARAIRDAIAHEVTTAAATLKEEIESGELGDKALENRRESCRELRAKIQLYEEILGEGLTALTRAVDEAELAESTVTMLAGSSAV